MTSKNVANHLAGWLFAARRWQWVSPKPRPLPEFVATPRSFCFWLNGNAGHLVRLVLNVADGRTRHWVRKAAGAAVLHLILSAFDERNYLQEIPLPAGL